MAEKMSKKIQDLIYFLRTGLWEIQADGRSSIKKLLIKILRIFTLTIENFVKDQCLVRAAALSYTTMLSLVPVVAVGLVAAKGFGAWSKLKQDVIYPQIAEFGKAGEVAEHVLDYVEKTNFASLGIFGVLLLFYAVISVMGAIEKTFNHIWGVKKQRNLLRKFTDYISILIIAPLLLVAASTIDALSSQLMAGLNSNFQILQTVFTYFKPFSFILIWSSFTFFYSFLPNRRIPLSSVIPSAIFCGTLYKLAQSMFFGLQVGVSKYNVIYGGIAALPITFIWVNISWIIILYGAELANSIENMSSIEKEGRTEGFSFAYKEAVGINIYINISDEFHKGNPPKSTVFIAEDLQIPLRLINELLYEFEHENILRQINMNDDYAYFQPARSLDSISLFDVVNALRKYSPDNNKEPPQIEDKRIKQILSKIDKQMLNTIGNLSVKEIVEDKKLLEST